jgi:hypothetical protein
LFAVTMTLSKIKEIGKEIGKEIDKGSKTKEIEN